MFLIAARAVLWLRFVTTTELRTHPWFGWRWAVLAPVRVCVSGGGCFFSRVAVAGHLSAGGQCFCITWAFLALPCHPSLVKLCLCQPTRFFLCFALPVPSPVPLGRERVTASQGQPARARRLCAVLSEATEGCAAAGLLSKQVIREQSWCDARREDTGRRRENLQSLESRAASGSDPIQTPCSGLATSSPALSHPVFVSFQSQCLRW